MKILKIIGKSTLYLVAALLLGFSFIFGLDFYYSIRGFQFIEPQPKYLLTIYESKENGKRDFSLIIEADLVKRCGIYKLEVAQDISNENTIVVNIDGLYRKKSFNCLFAAQRPKFQFQTSFKEEIDPSNLSVKLRDKVDKYQIKTSTTGQDVIIPYKGNFSEIIAYHYQGELIWKTEKYLYHY